MVQVSGGIGNVTTNAGLVEMAMAYSRSRVLCAAARLGLADALGDEVRSVGFLAEKSGRCQCAVPPASRTRQHRRDGRDDARTLSADSVWQTATEGRAAVRLGSRRLLG